MQDLNGLNDEQNLLTFTTFTKKTSYFYPNLLLYLFKDLFLNVDDGLKL